MPDPSGGWITAGVAAYSAYTGAQAGERAGNLEEAQFQLEAGRDAFNREQVEQTNAFALEDREDLISRRDRERGLLDPVQEGIIERANAGPDFEGAAARSDADVSQSFGLAREQETRRQQRYGVNPASGRASETNVRSGNQEALARAQGRNRSRLQEDDRDWARKIAALGTGNVRNAVPTTQLQQLGVSGASGVLNSMAESESANSAGAYQFAGSLYRDSMEYGVSGRPSESGGASVDYDFYNEDDYGGG